MLQPMSGVPLQPSVTNQPQTTGDSSGAKTKTTTNAKIHRLIDCSFDFALKLITRQII